MKISASLYSSTIKDLTSLVHDLDEFNLDYFHIDCFEGEEEKVKKDVRLIQAVSNTAIDLHAIGNNYKAFIDLAKDLQVKQLSLQYEDLPANFEVPLNRNFLFGLAVTNETSLDKIETFKDQIDYILLMTTTPGKSGGKFRKESFERIRTCKQLYPNLPIYVDGGINAEISFILRLLGVSLAVSGSFLVNHSNIGAALSDLRFHQKGSDFLVEDFMLDKSLLPILDSENCSFKEILQTIEDYKMGFVLYEQEQIFQGITSNADLRRGLLTNIDNLAAMPTAHLMNLNPITIQAKSSSYDMIELLKKYNFPILFLPVIDENRTLMGAITFNELIKGEG